MTELEKVVKGLECCITTCTLDECEKCPYIGKRDFVRIECETDLLRDALALLKARISRMLTLDEIIAACGEPVWFEENTLQGSYGAWGVVKGINEPYKAVEIGGVRYTYWAKAKYNITWRCWTSRPTDEQRKAVKWDE